MNDRKPPPGGRRPAIGHLEEASAGSRTRRWSDRWTSDRVDAESGFICDGHISRSLLHIVVLIAGLSLVAGKSEADTSIVNTASSIR
jgi:hypothetical protein